MGIIRRLCDICFHIVVFRDLLLTLLSICSLIVSLVIVLQSAVLLPLDLMSAIAFGIRGFGFRTCRPIGGAVFLKPVNIRL